MNSENRFQFFPALIGGLGHHYTSKRRVLGRDHLWKNKFSCSFWSDSSLFKCLNLLTSAYYSRTKTNWRAHMDIGEDATLMADSGGFQCATIGAKLDPLEILKWQEVNANIAFTLDIPPVNLEQKAVGPVSTTKLVWMSDAEFNVALEKTYQNNIVFEKNRTNKNLKIYNCLHGTSEDKFDRWFNRVKDFEFEGWAYGCKPVGDPLVQSMGLSRLYHRGIRDRVHLLGVGGINVLPVLIYCTKYFTNLTVDSSSYGQGYLTKKYLIPDDLTDSISFGRLRDPDEKHYSQYDSLPCMCPVCSEVEHLEILAQPGSIGGALIALHNLYSIVSFVDELKMMNERELLDYISENCPQRATEAVKFFDISVSQGHEKAMQTYRDYFSQEFVESRQLELF